jgi:hypothetical protein
MVAIVAGGMMLTGCGNQPTEVEDYVPDVVLSAFIYADEPIREIYLERVGSFQDYYDRAEYGITGADLVLIDVDRADTLRLMDDPDEPGHYIPENGAWLPRAMTRYRLEASFGDEFVWAETLMPGQFELTMLPAPVDGDTLTRNDENLAFNWTGADSAGGYVVNIVNFASRDSLVPLDPDWDPIEDEIEEDDKQQSLLWSMPDDQRTMTIPWGAFVWVGPYRVDFVAAPAVYYDYINTPPGSDIEIPSNVHGGIGIFAGMIRHSFQLYMEIADE